MKKVKMFIATSLDGFIARENGNLDWLDAIPNPSKSDFGYHDFISGIDEIIMGRVTYDWVLGSGHPWPYTNETYVISRQAEKRMETPNTKLMSGDWVVQVNEIRKKEGKDIWLVGGGQLITAFLDEGLVDAMTLSIIPVVLGSGLRLFPGKPLETYFRLTDSQSFAGGIVNLSYEKGSW